MNAERSLVKMVDAAIRDPAQHDRLMAYCREVDVWMDGFELLADETTRRTPLFKLGAWWADRPWRVK